MNSRPLISVLIPTYNREKKILRAINSVINQSYNNIEIIISDNCSEDNTEFEVKNIKDERIFYSRTTSNIGPVNNWLNCLDKAKGEYVYLLFSDDYLDTYCLEKHLNILKCNIDVAFSYSNLYSSNINRIDYNSTPIGIYSSIFFISNQILPEKSSISPGLPIKYPITPACALFRKIDMQKNLKLHFDNPLNIDFSNKFHNGMGNDKALFIFTANDYKYVNHLDEILVYSLPDNNNLSSIYGGQENFYYFLAIFDFIKKNQNNLYDKEWSKRCADFYSYLILKYDFLSLIKSIKNNISKTDIYTFYKTLFYLSLKIYIKLRYKIGIFKKNILAFK